MHSFTRSGKIGLFAAALGISVWGPGSLLSPMMATAQSRGPSLGTRSSDDTQRRQDNSRPADSGHARQEAQPQRAQPPPPAIPRQPEPPRRIEPDRSRSEPAVQRRPYFASPATPSPPPPVTRQEGNGATGRRGDGATGRGPELSPRSLPRSPQVAPSPRAGTGAGGAAIYRGAPADPSATPPAASIRRPSFGREERTRERDPWPHTGPSQPSQPSSAPARPGAGNAPSASLSPPVFRGATEHDLSPATRERYPARGPYLGLGRDTAPPSRSDPGRRAPDYRERLSDRDDTGARFTRPRGGERWLWSRDGYHRTISRHYEHRYSYRCPYGPVYVPVYVPVPEPVIVYEPGPEVLVPVAPEPEYPYLADRVETLRRIVSDIEVAWEEGDLNLLMQHVSPYSNIEILENGELLYALTRDAFRQHNADAFRQYQTVQMRFERPEILSETEAIAEGIHIFRDETGSERRVHVTYAFRKQVNRWWLVGVNFRGEDQEHVALPASDRPVASLVPAPADDPAIRFASAANRVQDVEPVAGPTEAPTPVREMALLWARKIRLAGLLAQPKPVRIATLRYRVGAGRATYDLDAMRGIVPHTVAWALYHRGDKTPVETGSTSLARMDAKAWVALRVLPKGAAQPALVTSRGRHVKATALPVHWIAAGQSLTLYETAAPSMRPVRHTRPRKATKRGDRA